MSKGSTKVREMRQVEGQVEGQKKLEDKEGKEGKKGKEDNRFSFIGGEMPEPHFSFSILRDFLRENSDVGDVRELFGKEDEDEEEDEDDWSCEFPYFTSK